MTSEIAKRCQNKWPSIFLGVGVDLSERVLNGRDGPCPHCGGKDRFRFSNKNGAGTWYCHGCNNGRGDGGDGVKLVMLVKGVDFKGAAKLIEGVIGQCWTTHGNGANGGDDKPKDPLRSWRDAYPDICGTPVETYLKNRGLILTAVARAALRFHPSLWHWPTKTKWPAMVAAVARADAFGALSVITCHQTFLAWDGSGKADVDKPKLFPSGVDPAGAGVWFGTAVPEREFVVAEGIESALSAMRLVGSDVGCAALSAWGIRKLELPPSARRVAVFADDDALQQGVAAANEARRRWQAEGRAVRVLQAREDSLDANDVWQRRMKISGRPA
jgi:putative DNA primase/helicase